MSRSDCRACWACWVYSNHEPHAGLTCSLSQVGEVAGVHTQPQLVLTQQTQQGQRPRPLPRRNSDARTRACAFLGARRLPLALPQRPGSHYTKCMTARLIRGEDGFIAEIIRELGALARFSHAQP
jgi:hypothetical protein